MKAFALVMALVATPADVGIYLPRTDQGDIHIHVSESGARVYNANAEPYYNALPGDWCYRWNSRYGRYLEDECKDQGRPTS